MWNLANFLWDQSSGLKQDTPPAVELYQRAIENSNHDMWICNLAVLLSKGAPGVKQDAVLAVALYEKSIDDHVHVGSMYSFSKRFSKGALDVSQDALRAVALYQRAIGQDYVDTMCELASLLSDGAPLVLKHALRAVAHSGS